MLNTLEKVTDTICIYDNKLEINWSDVRVKAESLIYKLASIIRESSAFA